ncbi:hypothetical protein AVEN_193765-1 [Araneus ventricosus]|uniref:Uncharacterized protein n=1 Tax=Araneus ventricosus TaxID=182803 RepID=A0A4Y2DL53_ARAVE|nr:hypothetical protein AVEN_193765-1 [Araneus ventricosus]
MKAVFILCCMAVVASLVSGDDYSINADFFDKAGLSRICNGNKTFSHYSMCEKRLRKTRRLPITAYDVDANALDDAFMSKS